MEKQLPKILYKYRGPFLCHQKKSLEKSEIFFSDPDDFNDPFDMKIRKKPELLSREDVILQTVYHISESSGNDSFASLWRRASDMYDRNMQSDPEYYKKRSIEGLVLEKEKLTRGVFCLTEKKDNILMWAHYGVSNRGFCLGYNTEKLIESIRKKCNHLGVFEVKYSTSYPVILPQVGSYEGFIHDKLATKSNQWSYEQEWRLITHGQAHFSIPIDREAIEEIILGSNIGQYYENEIREIQKRDFPHATLLKIFPDESEFMFNVHPI